MSFRLEEKIPLTKSDSCLLFNEIKKKGFKSLYPRRKIKSIYFDNATYQSFYDSIEGSLPRKKIRLRSYPLSPVINFNLEIKTSSIEGRFKTTQFVNNEKNKKFMVNGFLDNFYGHLRPICTVTYEREYYIKDGIRITLDTSITYQNYQNEIILFYEPKEVIEVKASSKTSKDFLVKLIPYSRHRFSKFCQAITSLNIQ